jgi:hypothetical protein
MGSTGAVPLQGLDLRFFVDREDHGVLGRGQVQVHDVADLVEKQRVGGDLVVLGAPRLQREGPPDAVHAGRRDPHPAGQFALGPVRCAFRDLFESAHDHLFHLGGGDVWGTPGRGSSCSPSSRRVRNRARHTVTVRRLTPSRAATAVLLPPPAQASTIRARSAKPCAVLRRRDQFFKVRRSSSDSTSGASGDSTDSESVHDRHDVSADRGVPPGLALVQAEATLS